MTDVFRKGIHIIAYTPSLSSPDCIPSNLPAVSHSPHTISYQPLNSHVHLLQVIWPTKLHASSAAISGILT